MFRTAATIFWKDLTVELRSREVVAPMIFFGVLVVLLSSFSLIGNEMPTGEMAAGVMWIAVALAGSIGVTRCFERERENDTFRALMLAPAPRVGVFIGKLAAILVFMLMVEIVVVPLVAVFFSVSLAENPGRLAALLALGTVGYSAAGALFGAALVRARSRDLLLSVLLYPIALPILIAGSKGTGALLDVKPQLQMVDVWIKFLFALDTIFLTLALWAFEPLSEEP